ncbi:MAG: 1-deoxy-D-xylulose-5-phosphate reductoisomerase [Lentisphaerae bacterium]|nr:1-deoxy-D-xylulose-5-phosphate reductoisomerase [Lentisphaerota bacterium]
MKRVVILGSTGSIGTNALRVAEALNDRLCVAGLAVRRNAAGVLEQAARFGVQHVAVLEPEAARQCKHAAPPGVRVYGGERGLEDLAGAARADLVLCAVVGLAGLKPVLAALDLGCDVALATKEVLVAAGGVVTEAAAANGVRLLPVDSEHGAVLQCLEGSGATGPGRAGPAAETVRRIVLTASGGPFYDRPEIDFEQVTVEEALAHPRWDMGRKISVDSATLMNKGLEIIEAHWLFGVPYDRIEVAVHPESIVHSLVEFRDGNMLAQVSIPDMRYAIQYALTWPERVDGGLPGLDLTRERTLRFLPADTGRFPCLRLARCAGERGGTLPAVLNAANEVAVQRFLDGRIPFADIARTVERVMADHAVVEAPRLEDILAADAAARRAAGGGA